MQHAALLTLWISSRGHIEKQKSRGTECSTWQPPPPQSMRNTETSGWERRGDGYLPLTKPRSLMFLKTDTADKDGEAQPKASKGEKNPTGFSQHRSLPLNASLMPYGNVRFETMPLRQRLLCIAPLCSSAPRLLSPALLCSAPYAAAAAHCARRESDLEDVNQDSVKGSLRSKRSALISKPGGADWHFGSPSKCKREPQSFESTGREARGEKAALRRSSTQPRRPCRAPLSTHQGAALLLQPPGRTPRLCWGLKAPPKPGVPPVQPGPVGTQELHSAGVLQGPLCQGEAKCLLPTAALDSAHSSRRAQGFF